MRLSHTAGVRRTSAALAMLAVAATGCTAQGDAEKAINDAQDFVSTATTCAELAKLAAGKLDDVRANLNDPARLEQTLRETTHELEAEAADVEDAQMKKAINEYVTTIRQAADRAEQGQDVDLDDLRQANSALTERCS